MIRLSVSEQGAPPRLMTFNQHHVSVGRSSNCELVLTGKGMSGQHCRFVRTPTGVMLEDLGSTNGTYVNRQKVTAPMPVRPTDEVIVALYEIRVMEDGAMVSAPPPGAMPQQAPARPHTSPRQATGVMPPSFPAAVTGPGVAPSASPQSMPPRGPAMPPQSMPPQSMQPQSGPQSMQPRGPAVPQSMPPQSSSRTTGTQGASATDADWARQWEKLDSLAREWIASGKDKRGLLRGDKLAHARKWLASGRGKTPPPRKEQRDLIFSSNRARQMRMVRNVTIGGLALSIGVVGIVKIVQIVSNESDVDPDAESIAQGSDGDTRDPQNDEPKGPRGGALAEVAAQAAQGVAAEDPVLATLLATEGLAQLNDERGSSAEQVFRSSIASLQGLPLRGHGESITDAEFSRDGRWAITASRDGSVRLWDRTANGSKGMIPLRGHSRSVLDIEVSADSKFLFTAGENGKIFRWGLGESDVMSTSVLLSGHTTAATALALSADGRWLVSGSSDGSVRVWNASSPVPKGRRFDGHTGPIRAVAIDPSGSRVLAASQDGTASIWKSKEGAPGRRTTLTAGSEEEPAEILDIAISADGEWVLTGHSNGVAKLWDPSRRIPSLTALTLAGHEGPVPHVAFTPDATLAITAGDDQKLRIWDLGEKDPSLSAPTFDLHTAKITDLVAVSGPPATPDAEAPKKPLARWAATASEDGTVRTWNLERRVHEQDSKAFSTEGGAATAVALSSDGQFILGGSRSGAATIWPAQSSSPPGASVVGWGHTAPVVSVAINPVGTRMVSVSADGTGKVWDLTRPGRATVISTLDKHEGQVVSVAISPDGRYVATGDSSGGLRVWDLNKPDPGNAALSLDKHKRGVRQLAFTQDGTRLVSLSSDAVYLWKLTKNAEETGVRLSQKDELIGFSISDDSRWLFTGGIKRLSLWDLSAKDIPASGKGLKKIHRLDIAALAIDPKGKWAASASKDATAVLWNLQKSAKAIDLYLHDKPIDAIAFSPDGHWMATGGQDQKIGLWDMTKARPQKGPQVLTGHEQRIGKLRFSRDSRWLVSASNDKSIRVFDLELSDAAAMSEQALVLTGHGGVVSDIDIAADARTIVSSSYDLTARVWPLSPKKLVPIGCLRAGRSLTREEWDQFFEGASFHRTCG